jgi:hypothetical protein
MEMAKLTRDIYNVVNHPGRIATLATADKKGIPDVAYFGSPRLMDDGTLVLGSGENRSLRNLRENPNAAFFCVDEAPVTPKTPGCRLYLKVKSIQDKGPVVEGIRKNIAMYFNKEAAEMIVAAVVFDVVDVRPLIAAGY